MPNLLAGRGLVPELLQEEVTGPALGEALLAQLQEGEKRAALLGEFRELGTRLRKSASERAADAVANLLATRSADSSEQA